MFKAKDYQKLFQVPLRYLISDIFAQHYKTLECLLIFDGNLWTSYLPKHVVEKTLNDGVELFSRQENLNKFENEFNKYISEAKSVFEETLKNELNKERAARFLYTLGDFWRFYSKTEFFYTDKIATLSQTPELTKNLETLGKIKNDGRLTMNSFIFDESNYFNKLLFKISKKFQIDIPTIESYGVEDILNLFDEQKVSPELINYRKEFFFMKGRDGKLFYGAGNEERKWFKDFLEQKTSELKGVVANKGKIIGRVKIFPQSYYSDFSMLKKLFSEMEEGDILVAETTSPELMPACKKAGAILTNQGGLLSHAAIVSRELNIPCIVGTGNATEILKDGDKVEIDADQGIVRIL